jgi:hypothetical protein
MAAMTYYVALAFKRSEDNGEVVACDPKEARSADQAILGLWPKSRVPRVGTRRMVKPKGRSYVL